MREGQHSCSLSVAMPSSPSYFISSLISHATCQLQCNRRSPASSLACSARLQSCPKTREKATCDRDTCTLLVAMPSSPSYLISSLVCQVPSWLEDTEETVQVACQLQCALRPRTSSPACAAKCMREDVGTACQLQGSECPHDSCPAYLVSSNLAAEHARNRLRSLSVAMRQSPSCFISSCLASGIQEGLDGACQL